MKIIILYDYKKFFARKFIGNESARSATTMNIQVLAEKFKDLGYDVECEEISQIDVAQDYTDCFVLYPSSEDEGLFYKDYIEDVILAISKRGARIIPSFEYFRAHSNKSFQEMIRKQFKTESLKTPEAVSIGHYDELELLKDKLACPVVIKVSNGAGSKGVALAKTWQDVCRISKELMTHTYRDFSRTRLAILNTKSRIIAHNILKRKKGIAPFHTPLRTNKIIIEEFIPNLTGDYKVLVFNGKYFVLNRKNRENDFRASGSGLFEFPTDISGIESILKMAKTATEEIKMPLISLDIGENENGCYLIEFQCLYFGPYTLQYAPVCYTHDTEGWKKHAGPFDLETEYVQAISKYIKEHNNK